MIFRKWGRNKQVQDRVQAALRGFVQRQRAREKERRDFQQWYWGEVLPARKIAKRSPDSKRDIYPAQRTPETHTETRRVGR